jgi:hypothetical protein
MKKITLLLCLCCIYQITGAQGSINSDVKLKELAVPKAPAFKLLDISPTQIESPTSPKQFALGVAQSFNDSLGWPKNYSMEFTPYWWLNPSNKNVYDFLGLKTTTDALGAKNIVGENAFSGLKLTSVSTAFINQDMIPDGKKQSQKIFSVGIHSTVIKIHSKDYAARLASRLAEWNAAAQNELDVALANQPPDSPMVIYQAYWQKFTDLKPTTTGKIFEAINDLINEKPLFSLDIAAAYASYGINDSIWRTGRAGVWSTVSSYLPLKLDNDKVNKNYFAFFLYFRFLQDNFAPATGNLTKKSSCTDIGGKLELQFDKLSFGYEVIHRNYTKPGIDRGNRNVGVINYQLGDNLYINGAFGKDFGITNKLISCLGINWGFGNEKVKLQ